MAPAPPPDDREPYTVYRSRPRLLSRLRRKPEEGALDSLYRDRVRSVPRPRRPLSAGRVVRWLVLAALGWIALSIALFLISAQLEHGEISDAAQSAVEPAGWTLTSAQTVLVLGSDQRTRENAEPGSSTTGPSRSDSIMLIRTGAGHNGRLSIPRDTVVDIPGYGRNKINAAYALGGPGLAIRTVEQFLGTEVNHVVEVNFRNFPELIDAMGGIDVYTGCVVSRINGGFRNGGFTLRLRRGRNHLDGRQALALARTRKNECNSSEDDRTRARRQQKIFSAMKSRLTSPRAFIRLPLIAWNAPKAIRSDMAGFSLLGLFGAQVIGGEAKPRVLKPSSVTTLGDGGAGLLVDDETRRRAVERFLDE